MPTHGTVGRKTAGNKHVHRSRGRCFMTMERLLPRLGDVCRSSLRANSMISIAYSLLLALAIIFVWSAISHLLFPAPQLDFANRWITQGVRCPHCDRTYTMTDVNSRLVGFSGDSAGATITCSACGVSSCFEMDYNCIHFVNFAPTDRYCLDCDNHFEGREDQECPFCGGLRAVDAEREDGDFHYRPKQATNNPMDVRTGNDLRTSGGRSRQGNS